MALARAPRSDAFNARQAAKAQTLAVKAQRRFVPDMARSLSDYFVGLSDRIVEALNDGVKADPSISLRYTDLTQIMDTSFFTGEKFWKREQATLQETLQKSMQKVGIAGVQGSAIITGQATSFTLDNPDVKDMRWRIAKEVKGINDETRKRLQNTVAQGIANGEHPSQIAKTLQIQAKGWAGLENLTASRAYTIARTETANAYNWTNLLSYKRSGIVKKVICHDAPDCGWVGHNGSELANGTHRTLADAGAHPVSHPNCVRAFSPAFGDEEPGIRQRKAIAPPPPPGMKPPPPGELDANLWADPKRFSGGHGTQWGSFGRDDAKPAEKWAQRISAKTDSISPAVRDAGQPVLRNYSGSGYTWMNDHLRGRSPIHHSQPEGVQKIEALSRYIDEFQTTETITVHRGVGSGRALLGKPQNQFYGGRSGMEFDKAGFENAAASAVGQTFDEQGFMSTALASEGSFSGVKLELTVPKGYPAVPVNGEALGTVQSGLDTFSTRPWSMAEGELLLQQGAKYVVDSYAIRGNTVTFYGRVLPRT